MPILAIIILLLLFFGLFYGEVLYMWCVMKLYKPKYSIVSEYKKIQTLKVGKEVYLYNVVNNKVKSNGDFIKIDILLANLLVMKNFKNIHEIKRINTIIKNQK